MNRASAASRSGSAGTSARSHAVRNASTNARRPPGPSAASARLIGMEDEGPAWAVAHTADSDLADVPWLVA